ncbi:UDP-2,3-diacylglucosamine diphosphatase [Flavilitoribacter nigricans]|uniref:UDP-2,3-diacylglucosamine hydrolase n=1 Tax=Flavilitoribacter nigricans (strain ATCC 23147 / DSM 23189 / NBRC 102662 / NCIMB 1420 / SS-2) TaxID=1122177 RepID=A0A2D0NHM1_FLAN2|nr:UDP-2,3-diacylglucosamine diphosphatase [Flavilitoribacter nigricans]PHN07669.1 UDP-2,3-diacylglucosamine hydrolase [Flavilitoribacter nigricans DSM 23189 = NBRC 102662]
MKKELDIVVLSDVHLGTYGCHAKELLQYLKSIKVGTLILNGDFIDMWQFRKRYFPREHLQVIQRILKMSTKGTKVYYITGNHDDLLRRYTDFSSGNIHLRDKMILHLNHKKYWIFHGDVFDLTIQYSPYIAKLGGKGYDLLIRLNRIINNLRTATGRPRMSFAKKVKNRVKEAIKFIADFEQTAIRLAREEGFDYVICGHIHRPQQRTVEEQGKTVTYLNSGDWVENLTALEYQNGQWSVYEYHEADYKMVSPRLQVDKQEVVDDEDRTDKVSPEELLLQIMNRNEKITVLGGS